MIRLIKIHITFILLILLQGCQSWFFRPTHESYHDPRVLGLDFEPIHIRSPWNERVNGFYIASKRKSNTNQAQGTVLYFYDGTHNATKHFKQITWLSDKNHELYTFDFQGYGKSTGKHTTQNMVEDATRFLNYVKHRKSQKLIVICQSTGAAICTKAIANWKNQESLDLLVIDSGYASYRELMKFYLSKSWWTAWLKYFVFLAVSDNEAGIDYLEKIKIPTLVMHSKKNKSVPFRFGFEIFDKVAGPKKLWQMQRGGHLKTFDIASNRDFLLDTILGLPNSMLP